MKAENIDTRTKPLIDVNMLCFMLRFVIERMKYPQVILLIAVVWQCERALLMFCHIFGFVYYRMCLKGENAIVNVCIETDFI